MKETRNGKQTNAEKIEAQLILAKTRTTGKLRGEGDYEAARRYDTDVRKFVRRADIGRAARAAAPKNSARRRRWPRPKPLGARVNRSRRAGFSLTWKAFAAGHARSSDAGAVTDNYQGDVKQAIDLLNHAVATEIVCVLRYKYHAVVATGISSDAVKEEFSQHAKEEEEHLDMLCERINQLGGKPNMNPEGLLSRAASAVRRR